MNKNRITIVGLTILICFVVVGYGWTAMGTEQAQVKDTKECHLRIEGMSCALCSMKIKNALKEFTISAEIDVEQGTGDFAYAEGKTSCKKLAEKVSETGFKATAQ